MFACALSAVRRLRIDCCLWLTVPTAKPVADFHRQVIGFEVFEVKDRAAREGRNHQDPAQVVKIPAKKVPVYSDAYQTITCY